jgi:hypothetical protein
MEKAMNSTKKVIFTLLAGATLGIASPVFADAYHYDRGYHNGYNKEHVRDYDRRSYYREHDRYARRPVIVERPYYVQRPVIVEQPVYYNQPVQNNMGLGAIIGAAIGTIYDNRQ